MMFDTVCTDMTSKAKGYRVTAEKGDGIVATISKVFGSIFHYKEELRNSDGSGSDHFSISSLNKETGFSTVVGTSKARLALPVKTGLLDGRNVYEGNAKALGTQMIDAIMPVAESLEKKGFSIGSYGDLGIGIWHDNSFSRSAIMFQHREIVEQVTVGDTVGFGVVARFGIDGCVKQTITAYLNRLECANGMVLPDNKGGYHFSRKHTIGFAGHASGIMNGLDGAIGRFAGTMPMFRTMVGARVSAESARKVIEEALGKRQADEALALWGRGRGQNGDLDAWNLYNTVTQVLSDNFHARPGQPDSIQRSGDALESILKLIG